MFRSIDKNDLGFAIFIIIIIVIAFTITGISILMYNLSHPTVVEETPGETYFTFKEVASATPIDIFKKYPVNPITVSYDDAVKISGLKDKSIQNKINLKLKNLEPSEVNGTKTCNITFNISNVLSLDCENNSITIDLTTGDEIYFEQIFNDQSDLYSHTLDAIYKSYCAYADCSSQEEDTDSNYYNKIENDIVSAYQKIINNNFSFRLFSNAIFLDFPDEEKYSTSAVKYEFSDYYPDITIYDRFLTSESIFDKPITTYCTPERCQYENISTPDAHTTGEFITSKNYLQTSIYNNTDYDITIENEYTKSNLDLEAISKKLIDELTLKYNLKRETSNYQHININMEIHNTNYNYKLVNYDITIEEMNKDNFIKNSLGSQNPKIVNTREIEAINLILTSNNNISYLESDPTKVFTNFTDTLRTYINNETTNNPNNNAFRGYAAYCELETNYKDCITNLNYNNLINDAAYAIDLDNQEILMYYVKGLGGGVASYVITKLPFDIFTLTTTEES